MTPDKELIQLHNTIRKCTLCELHKTRTKAVPGEGSPNAKLFFVGEAPGAREDETEDLLWADLGNFSQL